MYVMPECERSLALPQKLSSNVIGTHTTQKLTEYKILMHTL